MTTTGMRDGHLLGGGRRRRRRSDYLWTAAVVAIVTIVGAGLLRVLSLHNVALLYLVPVMMAASLFGLRAGLFAGVASSFAYNFFFLPPTGTLTISNPENVVTIFVLLGVALVTSQFGARVRTQADLAAANAETSAALAEFLRCLTRSATDGETARTICSEIGRLLKIETMLVMRSGPALGIRAATVPGVELGMIEAAAARWALDHGEPAGRGAETLAASDWLFYPVRGAERIHAAFGVAHAGAGEPLPPERLPLLTSLLDQAALGLERMQLEGEMREIAQLKERDRLRAALLSSVSHDLRTPLTTIMAASEALPDRDAPELVASIRAEAERLHRFVANLLDMARIEAGALPLRLDAIDVTDAVAAALHDVRRTLGSRPVRLELAPDLPMVRADATLLHHILINLLDNAGRYTEAGTPITVTGASRSDGLILSVLDEGPGLPAGREAELFETFRRFEGSDQTGGTGLGLAIVKDFAEAMGIAVEAANRGDGDGACFSLRFGERLLVPEREEA